MNSFYSRRLANKGLRIEMAPLIDIVFTLLIFFAISTKLIYNQGIKLDLPSAKSTLQQKTGIVVSIAKDNEIYFDNNKIKLNRLRPEIKNLLKKKPNSQIILRADNTTSYQLIIGVLDDIRLGGCFDVVLEANKKYEKAIL